ncbi:MAG: nucleotidyl transferase AbiEii/AbiGii toxin family protein, partial [Flavobacterium sp.]
MNREYMVYWQELSKTDKLQIFEETKKKTGLPIQAIEKDWWVTQTLGLIFTMDCAPHIVFKGGTSLSKAWNLIERFSEDIDLALDRRYLGFDAEMSKSQVGKLRKASFQFISTIFFSQLKEQFEKAGVTDLKIQLAEVKDTDQDPLIIEIYYPEVSPTSDYLKPRILVEIGSRSLREPCSPRVFSSLVGECYPNQSFGDKPITVPTVNPERTFLEKVFLLHEEFQKPEAKIRTDRLSRHLYDLEKVMDTPYFKIAITDDSLYHGIVNHRSGITPIRGIDYANHTPAKISIIPPASILKEWQKDYEIMQQNMIYGKSLTFEKLMK